MNLLTINKLDGYSAMKTDLFEKCFANSGNFPELKNETDHYLIEPRLDSPVGPRMMFQGKEKIMWSVNNYLGIANHPEITQAALKTLQTWGMSSPMGSRLMTGDSEFHEALEKKLAEYCQKPAALLCPFGYLGVIGTIPSLISRGDTILIDSLSHASIVDAAILAQEKSGIRLHPYKHNDMNDLESQLSSIATKYTGGALIVTEGVFGMHGDLGNLKDICLLKEKYGARVFVDDAHGIGVMGKNGRGTGEHFGIQDKIDLYYGTFTKAFGLMGGVVTGDKQIIDYIKFNSRTTIFSRSAPLVQVEAISKAVDIAFNNQKNLLQLRHIAKRLQDGLKKLGYNLGNTESPITPVYIPNGDMKLAIKITRFLRDEHDIFVTPVTYPVIPRGTILCRMIPTALHTDEDVDTTLHAFKMLREKILA